MVETLILVRHAKAEDESESGRDFDRELTHAGVFSCNAAMEQAASIIKSRYGTIKTSGKYSNASAPGLTLWTSPAPRAAQTACILANKIGYKTKDIEELPWLYEADSREFLNHMTDISGTLVVVGHNPCLEDVASDLLDEKVTLKKAAAIALDLEDSGNTNQNQDQTSFKARISWFLQGPDHKNWNTLCEIEQTLAIAAQRILTNAQELAFDQNDAETLHQYRVSLRVARSLALFVAPYFKRAEAKELLQLLKGLQAETSRLREYDVMWELLTTGDALRTYADAHMIALKLLPVRAKERSRFTEYFMSRKTQRAILQATELMQNIPWCKVALNQGIPNKDFCARFDSMAANYAQDLALCDFNDALATHDIRKRSKQLRYVARDFSVLLGEKRGEAESQAEDMQELLGRLCDARVNLRIAQELSADVPQQTPEFIQVQPDAQTFIASEQKTVDDLLEELSQ